MNSNAVLKQEISEIVPIQKEFQKEVSLAARELLGRLSRERKTTISMMSDGLYCIRIEKYFPNEKMVFVQDGKINFNVGSTYCGIVKSTVVFKDEFIAIIEIPKKEIPNVAC
jgi:hypothetical protein